MSILNPQQKLDLQNMVKANDANDYTQEIRDKKQSILIRNDIKTLLSLKNKYERLSKSNPQQFDTMCVSQCSFLFNNYTDIYNRIKNDTLNLEIMDKFLTILKRIEDGEIDQHEGSYLVGKYLKEMYVDSALRREKLEDKKYRKKHTKKPITIEKKISYKEFKLMHS